MAGEDSIMADPNDNGLLFRVLNPVRSNSWVVAFLMAIPAGLELDLKVAVVAVAGVSSASPLFS